MDSDNTSTGSTRKEEKGSTEKKVGFARPTLVIHTPQQRPTTLVIPGVRAVTPADRHEDHFGKRQYMYVFDQINDLKDFTVNTARSGLGVGEKCAYWLYNKIKDLSRKWFTHCFLSIILMIYTMGGALAFQKLEGPYEDEKEPLDMRTLTYELIEELTVLSEVMPFENQTDQWKITADEKVKGYILKVIENRQIENFIKANRGPKVWTLINSVVFCATIYTTIVSMVNSILINPMAFNFLAFESSKCTQPD
ncbi:hypothetical protein GWI33_006646 [Rhynchophorus ferrugineus]|uniref:Uncharacterized protein n=1 Tax=Rhynchophorus ferrugineus TaxID=354439 RepID=A0A834MH66_RHYFE|nr:hypothetical protein GWI33_006646 [Rhynchophorus ferrugineus]